MGSPPTGGKLMIDQQTVKTLVKDIMNRREEILDFRESLQSSRQLLQERENELEEMAGKEQMLVDVDRLDDRVVDELRKINLALINMQSGSYGRCDRCKRPIATKRLRAIPWTTLCKKCAQDLENQAARTDAEEDEFEESEVFLNDHQIVESIWDELDMNETLNLNDLRINCNNGTIHLAGSVPTEREHQQVLEIIEEHMGFEDVIDRIDISELNRRLYPEKQEAMRDEYEHETALQGEPPEDDPYAALDKNEPMLPPDELLPEDDRK
jgi:RNA polymerase-binding transcription factor DksA